MPSSSPRRWYRPHLAPLCAGLLVVGVLAFLNVPGKRNGLERVHGWPFTYLVRKLPPAYPAVFAPDIWTLTGDVRKFQPAVLLANATIAFFTAALVVAVLEWRRRRYGALQRFSLRSAAIVLLLCSLPLAWLGYRIEHWQRTRAVMERIKTGGGRVSYQQQLPDWLEELLPATWTEPFCFVDDVDLLGCQFTDSDLAIFNILTDVEAICLDGNPISNSGLQHLRHLDLRRLSMESTLIDDEGLVALRGMRRLEILNCDHTGVSDAGLRHLVGLTNLESLTLRSCHITDDGLRRLYGMHRLEELNLDGSKISANAAAELQAQLPQLMWFIFDKPDPIDPSVAP